MTDTEPKGTQNLASAERAIEQMYQAHSRKVYRTVKKFARGDHHLAQDVVQNVFKTAWETYESSFKGLSPTRVEATLIQLARWRAIDMFRKNRIHVFLISEFDEADLPVLLRAAPNPADLAADEATMRALWTALTDAQVLTTTEFRVAVLSWAIGLPDQAIAELLGIGKVTTVQSHRSKAKKKVGDFLRKEGAAIEFDRLNEYLDDEKSEDDPDEETTA